MFINFEQFEHPMFSKLYEFNFKPAEYLHHSRRQHFGGGHIGEYLWNEERARNFVSALILEELSLKNKICKIEDSRWEWTLALLSSERLARLARYLGAVYLRPKIRQSISKSDVINWTDIISKEAYEFVMHSAGLLRLNDIEVELDPMASVDAIGFGWIASSLLDTPVEISKRLNLKLPTNLTFVPVDSPVARNFVESVLFALEPKWCSLFAKIQN